MPPRDPQENETGLLADEKGKGGNAATAAEGGGDVPDVKVVGGGGGEGQADGRHGGGLAENLNGRLAFSIFAVAFGSAFQHGYNTGVLNAPETLITAWIQDCEGNETKTDAAAGSTEAGAEVTDGDAADTAGCTMTKANVTFLWAVIVAAFCVGGVFGGSAVGLVAGRVGRKGGLLLNNILMAIAGVCLLSAKYADSYHLLILGRLVIGINSGLNAGIAPMYLSEISPVALRGAVGTVYQLIITISILISQILGMNGVLGNEAGWPWLLGLTVIPGVIQLVTLPLCPESPKYLLLDRDNEEQATTALTWLRGRLDVHSELDEMRGEMEQIKANPPVSLRAMVVTSSLRKPLAIAMMMMLAQQLSGINAAMFFSTSIFESAGLEQVEAQGATLGMGTVNVLMTFVSLALIEVAGRKTLMIVGLAIMAVTTTLLLICLVLVKSNPALAYVSIVMVYGFVIGFATGPGSIPWFFVTELFTQAGRPIATSLAVVTNWSANFLVGLLFAPIRLAIGPYVFVIFIVIQILFIVYIYYVVPETKNRTVEEITAEFK